MRKFFFSESTPINIKSDTTFLSKSYNFRNGYISSIEATLGENKRDFSLSNTDEDSEHFNLNGSNVSEYLPSYKTLSDQNNFSDITREKNRGYFNGN